MALAQQLALQSWMWVSLFVQEGLLQAKKGCHLWPASSPLNIDMLMMNNTGNKAWPLPLETNTMALQSGPDTFTTRHVSLVSCSDNKGQQLSVHSFQGGCYSVPTLRLGSRAVALSFSHLCPGWEISAMISRPRAIMPWRPEVKPFRQSWVLTQLVITDVGLLWGLSGVQVVCFDGNTLV